MKKFVSAAAVVLSALLITGCSGDGSYKDFNELTKAVESAGISCDADKTVTLIDDTGRALTCNDSYTMYLYEDQQGMRSQMEFIDETRQGIMTSHWVVGSGWYVIASNKDQATKLQKKIGGDVVQIGS
ncbi:MAG: hypothetical protein L0H57_12420 [Yaniella sp.]|nr:hypothetical protein [Yaniella sp.]